MQTVNQNIKPEFDTVLRSIVDYVFDKEIKSTLAYETAVLTLQDALGCAILALEFPACTKLLGPIVPGAECAAGAKVLGTHFQLDPVQATFNLGAMIRWLDYNDTWLAAEWGHPSDNIAGILMVADYLDRNRLRALTMRDVLTAMIKAHEIQGILALENSFNRVGLDHVVLVKVATTAVVSCLLGADKQTALSALSNAFVDGQALRTYRHAPNVGSRKSWAAGDAAARGVFLSLLAQRGEMGYPSCLTVKTWGFYEVLFKGNTFQLSRDFDSYVMENVLFKISYPAEFHAQTAVECAVQLHEKVKHKLEQVDTIHITTHESAIRIISKTGPLHNPADRDHCLQYMIAIALISGNLTADDYEDAVAANPLIDVLRAKMIVTEDKQFSRDYLNPKKRSIANQLKITFKDGLQTEAIKIEYPLGHQCRREEGVPLLKQKFKMNLLSHFGKIETQSIMNLFKQKERLFSLPVSQFVNVWV